MTTVTIQDMRACRYCSRGARAFAQRHGIDWPTFCRQGVPAETLIATGDAMAAAVVRAAKERERG